MSTIPRIVILSAAKDLGLTSEILRCAQDDKQQGSQGDKRRSSQGDKRVLSIPIAFLPTQASA